MTEFRTAGDARFTRLVETTDAGGVIMKIVGEMTPEAMRPYAADFPECVAASGTVLAPVQSFLLFADGKRILIDACSGNEKPLGGIWGNLHTDFFERLSALTPPEDIDFVICTHFHGDHVGWNTRLVDGKWVPAFPNAAYIFSAAEIERIRAILPRLDATGFAVWRDSVEPILESGQARLVADDAALTPSVRLVPTPGHTAHHLAVSLRGEKSVLFCGDLFYHACQIEHPDWGAKTNPTLRATRLRMLADAAANGTLLFFGHAPYPLKVSRKAGGYTAQPVRELTL